MTRSASYTTLTDVTRRRGGSSRGVLSAGRSPCISVACIAVHRARCAAVSLAWLDHVWPLLRRGLNPSAFARLAEGEGIEPPRACASPVFETGAVADRRLVPPRRSGWGTIPQGP